MKKLILFLLAISVIPLSHVHAENRVVQNLFEQYASQGVTQPSAERGEKLWQQRFSATGKFSERSCTSCHTSNINKSGKHIRTNKVIKPMSPTENPKRLTNMKKVNKWFKRNCKWTFGRECSAQEKADILAYLSKSVMKQK